MPRPCSICKHEKRDEINADLLKGKSYRSISHVYSVSPDAARRHDKNGHISKELIEADQGEAGERVGTVWEEIDYWAKEIKDIYRTEKTAGHSTVALSAIEKALKIPALIAQIRATLGEEQRGVDPIALAVDAVECLREPYPEALTFLLNRWREEYERDCS